MRYFAGNAGAGSGSEVDVQTALMIPLVAAMLADGRVEEDELLEIYAICGASPVFDRNTKAETEALISHVTRLVQDEGLEKACGMARETLSPNLRETAFVHAMRVIFSDGYVGKLEEQVTDQMTSWLQIDPARAKMMIAVVSVMQHPATA